VHVKSLFFSDVTPYHCVTGDKRLLQGDNHMLNFKDVHGYFDP